MMTSNIRRFAILIVLLSSTSARAELKLSALFTDHMVLQRDQEVAVWGWAEPGQAVKVTIADAVAQAKAGDDGRWKAVLPKLSAGGPHTLAVAAGDETKSIADVLVGEVWLCSGQSNMAMAVRSARDFEKEQPAANLPKIRVFTERSAAAAEPQTQCSGTWEVCSPETVGGFSATAFFFGREIHKSLNVPVGLINSSVGGTPIESWIARDVQRADPRLKPFFEAQDALDAEFNPEAATKKYQADLAKWKERAAAAKAAGKPVPRQPQDPVAVRKRKGNNGGLFNGKIAPLVGYGIRGALWYQGEANAQPGKGEYYQYQLPLLVKDWRAKWGQGEFPFAWVQLPNYDSNREGWMLVREAMLKTLAVPNTGMAITVDIGESRDIHPKNKQDVGKRLAFWARGAVYGEQIETSGPLPAGHKIDGARVVVTLSHADGLKTRDGSEVRGFELAGADGAWKAAEARIDGTNVVVTSAAVAEPKALRYAWADEPDVNLVNAADLPASPFRVGEVSN